MEYQPIGIFSPLCETHPQCPVLNGGMCSARQAFKDAETKGGGDTREVQVRFAFDGVVSRSGDPYRFFTIFSGNSQHQLDIRHFPDVPSQCPLWHPDYVPDSLFMLVSGLHGR